MARIAYVNGDFVPLEDAKISVMDRGFLFADGVYEVTAVLDGHLVDNEPHMARLTRSLSELDMEPPVAVADIPALQNELIRQNGLDEGVVYLQITRGVAERDFAYPEDPDPTFIMFTQVKQLVDNPAGKNGIEVITMPDIRWRRRDIKSTSLLPQAIAKQAALDAGATDAWFVEDGFVTEGTANNAYIITKDGAIVTRPLSSDILAGCTRLSALALARESQLRVEERRFTLEEAYGAAEAFLSSASTLVTPVVKIDDHQIGDGKPGPMTRRLRELYIEFARG